MLEINDKKQNTSTAMHDEFVSPAELHRCEQDMAALSHAIQSGDLSGKCSVDYKSDTLRHMGNHVNNIISQLRTPLYAASESLERIAHGNIPEFIIEEYSGEFNQIKKNINNFLATMYGMHYEVNHLIGKIRSGELRTRGNDWDYAGIWQELIAGVNSVLDAIIEPVTDASYVLEQVSKYNLTTRMTAKYQGEHARIKHALNGTIDTLSLALTKVAEVVKIVSQAGEDVLSASQSMNKGSEQQAEKVRETSKTLEKLLLFCSENTTHAQTASTLSKDVHENIFLEKERMAELLKAMEDIKRQAEGTQEIIRAMTEIGNQTDELSVKASTEAVNVTSSSRGFSVVAEQIGRLAEQSMGAARSMSGINGEINEMIRSGELERLPEMVSKLDRIARDIADTSRETKFIAVNAAVNSAHVSDSGESFEDIVTTIKSLSGRNKDATVQSEKLIHDSIDMSAKGESLSREVNDDLEAIVQKVTKVAELVRHNETSSKSQTTGINELNSAVAIISDVTGQNASIAERSEEIAKELARQTQVLSGIVNQFQLRN
ncbi:MAG: methyl-accepting chemotaxis protein [Deltaproteobacteria bacterium]|nr:methyl-accepting chemotaxis protein [Deltaproteobacteria bacterium]